jgi:hypothetical protein
MTPLLIFSSAGPGPPAAIKVTKDSDHSAIVSWTEPTDLNGFLLGYRITVEPNPVNTSMSRAVFSVKPAKTSNYYKLSYLNPKRSYEAWVTAFNSAGEGKKSKAVRFSVKSEGTLECL